MGLRAFERRDRSATLAIALDAAASTHRGEVSVVAMIRRLRETRITPTASSTLEWVALVARAQARCHAFKSLARDLTPDQVQDLEELLSVALASGRTRLT